MIKLLCMDNEYENAAEQNLCKWYYIAVDKIAYLGVPHGEEDIRGCEIRLTTGELLICIEEFDIVCDKLSRMWSKR
jgi:hypothetical protein